MQLPTALPQLSDGADLILRRHVEGDIAGIVDHCQDPESQRWTTVPVPYAEADAREFLAHVVQGWQSGAMAAFAVELEGRFAGTVDLRFQEGDWAEVGYGLAAWARGRHVMRRSLAQVLNWAFNEVGLIGVGWRAHVGNEASRRVAEACGFRVEGTVRGLCVQRGKRFDAWIGTVMSSDIRPASSLAG